MKNHQRLSTSADCLTYRSAAISSGNAGRAFLPVLVAFLLGVIGEVGAGELPNPAVPPAHSGETQLAFGIGEKLEGTPENSVSGERKAIDRLEELKEEEQWEKLLTVSGELTNAGHPEALLYHQLAEKMIRQRNGFVTLARKALGEENWPVASDNADRALQIDENCLEARQIIEQVSQHTGAKLKINALVNGKPVVAKVCFGSSAKSYSSDQALTGFRRTKRYYATVRYEEKDTVYLARLEYSPRRQEEELTISLEGPFPIVSNTAELRKQLSKEATAPVIFLRAGVYATAKGEGRFYVRRALTLIGEASDKTIFHFDPDGGNIMILNSVEGKQVHFENLTFSGNVLHLIRPCSGVKLSLRNCVCKMNPAGAVFDSVPHCRLRMESCISGQISVDRHSTLELFQCFVSNRSGPLANAVSGNRGAKLKIVNSELLSNGRNGVIFCSDNVSATVINSKIRNSYGRAVDIGNLNSFFAESCVFRAVRYFSLTYNDSKAYFNYCQFRISKGPAFSGKLNLFYHNCTYHGPAKMFDKYFPVGCKSPSYIHNPNRF